MDQKWRYQVLSQRDGLDERGTIVWNAHPVFVTAMKGGGSYPPVGEASTQLASILDWLPRWLQ